MLAGDNVVAAGARDVLAVVGDNVVAAVAEAVLADETECALRKWRKLCFHSRLLVHEIPGYN